MNLYRQARHFAKRTLVATQAKLRDMSVLSDTQWLRVVMNRQTRALMAQHDCKSMRALEISGEGWRDFGFASYQSASFPDYDWCAGPLATEAFDVVIAEQVLEHVLWPYRAVRNSWQMLRGGGVLLVTTPFLIRVHHGPEDCSRWTETGLKHLLAEGGFPIEDIQTGSWGNLACLKANLFRWRNWVPWLHSLHNDPRFPLVVWACARKQRELL